MRTLLRLSTLSIAVLLFAAPAVAQDPDPADPTVINGTRPGVIDRNPDPDEETGEPLDPTGDETGDPDGDPDADADADADPDNTAGDPPQTDPTGDLGAPGDRPPGPRVLTEEELGLDNIDENFAVDDFDPINPPRDIRVNIDFNEADLNDVVMWISALTGRNFIIADTISSQKKITIISPQPVTISEAYRAFIAALHMNGLTIVPFGRFLKIVEADAAVRSPLIPSTRESQIPDDDRMVTHIHQLQHVTIEAVQSVLDAMKTEAATIVTYEPTNTMIITETGSNLLRLLDILDELDVPSGQERIYMYQVQYSDASELAGTLLEIFEQDDSGSNAGDDDSPRRRRRNDDDDDASSDEVSDSAGSATVSQIIPDERTNQLIIIANERSYARIMEITQRLDIPIPGEGEVHVIFLENADATELAATLASLTQSIEQQREETSGRRRNDDDEGGGEGAVSATFTGDVSITADEATNALVVVASLRDFLSLQEVVGLLDRRRQQVYVEAVIMEVSISRTNQFGIALNSGALPNIGGEDVPVFGATSLSGLTSLFIDPTSLMGLAVGLQGPEIDGIQEALGFNLPSFGAILQAVQTDNDVNILSTPHILTMDNEEAEIIVGENIPFISGIQGGSGLGGLANLAGGLDLGDTDIPGGLGSALSGFGSPSVTVQRQDVALTLRITPQINESNFVRLELEVQVEDVQSIDPVLGPRTTTRQARTTVVVEDQQTVVIGGLMRDTYIEDVQKVPILGDIPVIGHFFRNTTTRINKTNLLLLLTPYIIRDASDFQEIFRRKMEEREEFIAYFGHRDHNYVAAVDYGRKDGPLQSIFEVIIEAVEADEQRVRAFGTNTQERDLNGVVEPLRINVEDGASE